MTSQIKSREDPEAGSKRDSDKAQPASSRLKIHIPLGRWLCSFDPVLWHFIHFLLSWAHNYSHLTFTTPFRCLRCSLILQVESWARRKQEKDGRTVSYGCNLLLVEKYLTQALEVIRRNLSLACTTLVILRQPAPMTIWAIALQSLHGEQHVFTKQTHYFEWHRASLRLTSSIWSRQQKTWAALSASSTLTA